MEVAMSSERKTAKSGPACTNPQLGSRVYDYFNGVLREELVPEFEKHMVACAACERAIIELEVSIAILSEEQKVGAGKSSGPSRSRKRD